MKPDAWDQMIADAVHEWDSAPLPEPQLGGQELLRAAGSMLAGAAAAAALGIWPVNAGSEPRLRLGDPAALAEQEPEMEVQVQAESWLV